MVSFVMTITPEAILLRLSRHELRLLRSEAMDAHDPDPPCGVAGDRAGWIAAVFVGGEFESLSQSCHQTPWQAEADLRPELRLRNRI
jgi:hypothetical protein